jgi:osmotically-inducible protein OsmY
MKSVINTQVPAVTTSRAIRRRPLAALALCAAVAVSLQACVGLMVGGAVMGTLAATDRRTLGAQSDDTAISLKGEGRASKITGDLGRVAVTSFNRKVLLTGEVKDQQMKAEVEQQIKTIDNVQSIEDDLVVAPVSSMGVRSNDALITGKVRAAIIDTKDLYVNAIKVHTDRGVVYLMGRVTQREGKLAAEVTRNSASNIRKVVKLFEYISEEELKDMVAKPDTSAPKAEKKSN